MAVSFCSSLLLFLLLSFTFLPSANGTGNTSVEHRSPKEKVIYYDLPVQSLTSGLMEFAIQSETSIILDNKVEASFTTTPVVGSFQIDEALSLILSKTPYQYRYIKSASVFIIENKDKSANSKNINEKAEFKEQQLEELIVKGRRLPHRYTTVTSSQVHSGLSVYDSSRFINSIPGTLIEDQKSNDLVSILRLGSGVTPGDGLANSNDDFYIRGFPRFGLYLDGYRLDETSGFKIMPSNIDRVEILKGPSTLLYGQAEPGGIVNVVRKRPKKIKKTNIELSTGSQGKKQAQIDSMSFFDIGEGALSYRIIYDNDQYDQYLDSKQLSRELLSPSLEWHDGDKTRIGINVDFQKSSRTRNQGSIVVSPTNDSFDFISLNTTPLQARPNFESELLFSNIDVTRRIAETWILKGSFFSTSEKRLGVRANRDNIFFSDGLVTASALEPDVNVIVLPGGIVIPIDDGTEITNSDETLTVATIQSLYDEESEIKSNFLRFRLEGSPELLTYTHHLSTGFDIREQRLTESYILAGRNDIESINLANNGNSNAGVPVELNGDQPIDTLTLRSQTIKTQELGFFVKDSIDLSEKIVGNIGSRYIYTKGEQANSDTAQYNDLKTFEEISSDFGLVYKQSDLINYYANFSESVKANYQIDDVGTKIEKPELSKQIELGLKGLLFDNSLSYTLGLYTIDKENIVSVNFSNGVRTSALSESQTSNGIDLDFSYQTNNLNIVGSYAYNDTTVSEGSFKGNNPPLVSEESVSVFVYKHFALSENHKTNISFGTYYVGDRFGNMENTEILDAYLTLDAGISYTYTTKGNPYSIRLFIKNISDKEYITSQSGNIRTNNGEGRTFEISLKSTF